MCKRQCPSPKAPNSAPTRSKRCSTRVARDTRLNRDVALKLLPGGKFTGPERRARFIQEASALNHSNIVTIHEINEDAGPGARSRAR